MKAANDDDEWQMAYDANGKMLTLSMPEEDAREIIARAKAAGISPETYIRRGFGLPDTPSDPAL